MDVLTLIQITAAVILGNAAFALCAFALYSTWRMQTKDGKTQDELPLWVYPCLIAAPLLVAVGFYLSPVH